MLGRYGATDGREYLQYFLHDDNRTEGGCPFAKLAQNKTPQAEDKEQAA
jgi:FPC/CPF motif-containing protein YcgG